MGTGLKGLIQKRKSEIIRNWFEATIQTYAPDTAQFLLLQELDGTKIRRKTVP